MEKKSKKSILIGITCLFLVMILLLGLTYAYYRTRIIGNESNEPSISVQSKKMEVVYQDGTATMNMEGNIEPGFVATKTFSVINEGNQNVTYSIVLDKIDNEFTRNQDLQYTLTGENLSSPITGHIVTGTKQIIIPKVEMAYDENTKITHSYTLTLKYIEADVDQSIDMGKNLSFRVNIEDEQITWDNAFEGTLLAAIKNSSISRTQVTVPGEELNAVGEKVLLNTEDDYGTSYYYRGEVDSNYVTFAGMCWRIVRVLGDGRIKLILQDQDEVCSQTMNGNWDIPTSDGTNLTNFHTGSYGRESLSSLKASYLKPYSTGGIDRSMVHAFYYFQENSLKEYVDYLTEDQWCTNDDAYLRTGGSSPNYTYKKVNAVDYTDTINVYYYDAYTRLRNLQPDLRCVNKGTTFTHYADSDTNPTPMYVGAITADELTFAGTKIVNYSPDTFYLKESKDYLALTLQTYKNNTDGAFTYTYAGGMSTYGVGDTSPSFRPVIVLASNVKVNANGVGTQENPYVLQ